VSTTLLATDLQRSVLNALDATQPNPLAYTPYGHRPVGNGLLSLLGFNGERPDPVTGHYHLGNGYRQFNPVLMRFNSPDSWSPFGEGGLNAYAYCAGDSINHSDPTGHTISALSRLAPPPPPRPVNLGFQRARGATTSRPLMKSSTTASPKNSQALTKRRHSDTFDSLAANERKINDAIINNTQKYDLIGYHGSTEEHTKSLATGLSAKYMGSRNGTDSGRGFYVTPDYESAVGWATVSKRAESSSPKIFGAYTRNFETLKPGRDYSVNTELNSALKNHVQIIIKEPAYSSVRIKAIQNKQSAIRLHSHEAPF
jgi:RHS repeat-associated protein